MSVPYLLAAVAFLGASSSIFAINLLITDVFLKDRVLQRARLDTRQRERLKERARQFAGNRSLAELTTDAIANQDEKSSVLTWLRRMIEQSGVNISVQRLMTISCVLGVGIGGMAGAVVRSFPIGILVSLAVLCIPTLYVNMRRTSRLERLRSQLPDALELMSRILRAGQTMSQAMLAVSTEFEQPLGGELGFCYEQQNLGLSPDLALQELSRRTGVLEVKIFVLAMLVHRRSGGNLAELLEKLSGTIRERYKIRGKIRTLTAEGRLQAIILIGLPFLVFFLLLAVNPTYTLKLFDHPSLIVASLIGMVLGACWIRKIVNFDF